MNEDRVALAVACVAGMAAFALLALVAERTAVATVDVWRYPWPDDIGGRLLKTSRFWALLVSLLLGAAVSFSLAWMMRDTARDSMRIALFAAFAFLVTAFMAVTVTATAVHSGVVVLVSDEFLASLHGVAAGALA